MYVCVCMCVCACMCVTALSGTYNSGPSRWHYRSTEQSLCEQTGGQREGRGRRAGEESRGGGRHVHWLFQDARWARCPFNKFNLLCWYSFCLLTLFIFCLYLCRRVTTLCHCIASDDDQLSFQKGMQLVIICDVSGSDWLLCRHGDREGLVHRACVKTVTWG